MVGAPGRNRVTVESPRHVFWIHFNNFHSLNVLLFHYITIKTEKRKLEVIDITGKLRFAHITNTLHTSYFP